MGYVKTCGVCDSKDLVAVLDMGVQPLAERESENYPLKLVQCMKCQLVQLNYIVDQHEVFPADHPYSTGNTQFLRNHFDGLALKLSDELQPGDVVVDIGANDGTFVNSLKVYRPDVIVLAVEPTDQAAKIAEDIPVWKEFFSFDVAKDIVLKYNKAKIVVATNVLAHVPDPMEFVSCVWDLLDEGGTFITENHNWASIALGLQFDTVYHEHLRYYSPTSLGYLLEKNDLTIKSIEMVPTHGGSFRTYTVKNSESLDFRAEKLASDIRSVVRKASSEGLIYGIGAATRATPMLHYTEIAGYISRICEPPGSDKIGMLMPGTHIPVVDDNELIVQQPEFALMLNWHIAETVMPKLRKMGYRGQFIVPMPEPRIIRG